MILILSLRKIFLPALVSKTGDRTVDMFKAVKMAPIELSWCHFFGNPNYAFAKNTKLEALIVKSKNISLGFFGCVDCSKSKWFLQVRCTCLLYLLGFFLLNAVCPRILPVFTAYNLASEPFSCFLSPIVTSENFSNSCCAFLFSICEGSSVISLICHGEAHRQELHRWSAYQSCNAHCRKELEVFVYHA